MNRAYWSYWGKADPAYQGDATWHPLVYHSLDVAACGQILLDEHPQWLATLSVTSGLPTDLLHRWVVFLLAIHDIGKFADGFQQKRIDLCKMLQGREPSVGGDQRHDTLGYLLTISNLLDWLGQESTDDDLSDLLNPWLAAVTGHHGKPPKNENHGTRQLLLRDHFQAPVMEAARQYVIHAAKIFLNGIFPLPKPVRGLAEQYQQSSWLVAGVSVAADWLGSNTRWFPYRKRETNLEDYWAQVALPQARTAVNESGLLPAAPARFYNIQTLFPRIREATSLQVWAQETPIDDGPQLFVLEELTGGGKTEAAMTLAARLMQAGSGQGVYLALPTMATADAMFDRLRVRDEEGQQNWQRFFTKNQGQLVLAHSAANVKRLRLEKANRHDGGYPGREELSASLQCATWLTDSRKKALLADFGIGTIDQALLSVLPVRHQSLRLLGLTGKILIVDEVHACDAYMGKLLSGLLEFHAAMGGSAILLSATLPSSQRKQYLEAFTKGAGKPTPTLTSAEYPLSSQWSHKRCEEQLHQARASSARTVSAQMLHTEEEVIGRLKDKIGSGGCAVWIRNSVADAVESWRQWQERFPQFPAILFHARFTLHDRLNIGSRILSSFGPDSPPELRRGQLVIATQVIEQSLDVDFDDMVTDIAPIDLIIQRAGRLQRHNRDATGGRLGEGSDERGGARLGILAPDPLSNSGKDWVASFLPRTGKVYPDHGKLWLTAHWLKKNGGFSLPEQARDMVETVYSEEPSDIPEALIPISCKADGANRAGVSTARLNLLKITAGYCPTNLQWEEDARTPTRLNDIATVRVRLARQVNDTLFPWAQGESSLAWHLSELNVPEYLVASEYPADRHPLEILRAGMADAGRYVKIIILKEKTSEGGMANVWTGHALNLNGQETQVSYSSTMGFALETGVNDESDQ